MILDLFLTIGFFVLIWLIVLFFQAGKMIYNGHKDKRRRKNKA
jgi:hypothetical protein